jgi:MFS family permease
VSTYRSLLSTPGVARIISAQLLARFPFGMLSLAYLLHIERVQHSYGAAGLVLAAASIGQAIAGPLTSRWMGAWGMRNVLTLTATVAALGMVAIALLTLSLPVTMLLAFIGGLSTPPVQPAVRTIYPKMVTSNQLTPLFSLDASAQEIIWVLGPVITTFVSVQIGTVEGILLAAVILVAGSAWFLSSPELGRVRIPRSKRRLGSVLTKRPVILATIAGFLLIGACSAVEAGVVAALGNGGAIAGIVLGVFSIGSLFGGLAFGHRPIRPWTLAIRLSIVAVGMLAACLWLNPFWIAATLFLAGIGIAPALAVLFGIVSASVRFSDTAEAYGWVGTGQLIGAALGSAIAGFLIDGTGPIGAFFVAGLLALVGAVVAGVFHRWSPDLRGRDASPIPDTEPLEVIT